MKVYHISDTLELNKELKLDYKNQQDLAEPFYPLQCSVGVG